MLSGVSSGSASAWVAFSSGGSAISMDIVGRGSGEDGGEADSIMI